MYNAITCDQCLVVFLSICVCAICDSNSQGLSVYLWMFCACCSLLSTVRLQTFKTVLGDLLLRLSLVSLVRPPLFFITLVGRYCWSFTHLYSSKWMKFQVFVFLFFLAGAIQGLHNIHGSFNVPNMPGTLASRNSAINNVPSGGVQQPSGSLSSGRFASNNIPVGLSQVLVLSMPYMVWDNWLQFRISLSCYFPVCVSICIHSHSSGLSPQSFFVQNCFVVISWQLPWTFRSHK